MSYGVNTVLVVVDRFSKYAHFLALRHPFTAMTVAQVFVKEIIKLHGFPTSIISDRDRIFLSSFWKEIFRLQGTNLKRSTSYHPQTDGQTEIVNKALETYLRCFAGGQPKSWSKWLHWAEFSYNTSTHMSTKLTPFKVLYGRDPPVVNRLGKGHSPVDSVEAILMERDAMLEDLHMNLLKAQQTMKANADKKRRDDSLTVGEKVYVKLQPYRQQTVVRRPCEKLAAKFYGPFEVLERIGQVAYRLQLPETSKVHPVFHISQLKRAIGTLPSSITIPDQFNSEVEFVTEPEVLVDVRQLQQGNKPVMEVLIKWKGLPFFEATWEEARSFAERFPGFHLEDKVRLWRPGNVMNGKGSQTLISYARKGKKGNAGGKGKEVLSGETEGQNGHY